ncbi:DUF3800 domain-containing protein [Confluentibacter sediminis]|uniref:DUF3800 domain-containing protein n=1 Tax=Confluentibacter sediminis TaxID=2219045 RepID=UPI000DAE21E7|nr:DUF3800 domain-containing protein [Confluentibacter sediminis]
MSHNVYLDESGDLGFNFSAPYRKGGSSRYLTIAFIICPKEKKHLLQRVVKRTYQKYNFNPKVEIKASSLSNAIKKDVSKKIINLIIDNPDISINSITVNKQRVQEHIREDCNLLYNYMMRLCLLDKIDSFSLINLIRDNKSVKIKSGNSLSDYLKTTMYFELGSKTQIVDIPSDSKKVTNLVLADWLNNIVWGNYEDNNAEPYILLSSKLKNQTLFF